MRRFAQFCSYATATVVGGLLFFTHVVDPSFVYVVDGCVALGLTLGTDFAKNVAGD